VGRSRDVGDVRFATVAEAAEALGVTAQAIYNRIKHRTIPYEQHIDEATARPSYRIPRDWLEREVARKVSSAPASSAELAHEGEMRAAEIIATFVEHAEAIRNEIEIQHTKLEPLLVKLGGQLEAIRANQGEMYKQIRTAVARAEEANRREREFQTSNLELAKENRDLQRQTLELLGRVEQAERERAEQGRAERRSFWRRLFSGE